MDSARTNPGTSNGPAAAGTLESTDDLATDCLRAARDLGHSRSYRQANVSMETVRKNIVLLSQPERLSTTQRSLLATSVLYYLWNAVGMQKAPRQFGPEIIDINDYNKLADVIMTCFVWIMSYQDGRLGLNLNQLYSLLDEDVSDWDTEHFEFLDGLGSGTTTTDSGSSGININPVENGRYFDLIRAKSIDWVKEIVTDFNKMTKTTQIVKLNNRRRSAKDIAHGQRLETVTDAVIKALLSHIRNENELIQCWNIMEAHSSWLTPPWLSTLAIAVLLFLGATASERGSANCAQSEEFRRFISTCLHWIESIDKDLSGVQILADEITPGSMISWKHHESGALRNIWHRIPTFEGMENPVEVSMQVTGETVLCHATTCKSLIQMLREAAVRDGGRTLTINGRKSKLNYPGSSLVWTGVQLKAEDMETIPKACLGKQLLIDSPTSYGSVCLQFPLVSVMGIRNNYAHFLSTRKYMYEYSQSILVTPFEEVFFREEEKSKTSTPDVAFGRMCETINLSGYMWNLAFSESAVDKSWTHPELVFAGDLSIPLENVTISFIGHSGCVGYVTRSEKKTCDDCRDRDNRVASACEARKKFYDLLKEGENQQLEEIYNIPEIPKLTYYGAKVLNLDISLRQPPVSPPKRQCLDTRQ